MATSSLNNLKPSVILYFHGLFYHNDSVKINLGNIHQGKCNGASLKLSSIFYHGYPFKSSYSSLLDTFILNKAFLQCGTFQ